MTAAPATATFSEFARLAGFKRSYVTQLRKDGRLVLAGRRVDVAASLERIKATSDPSKQPVADRHAAARAAAAGGGDDDAAPDDAPALPADTPAGMSYQSARALREQYQALKAKQEYEIAEQQLLNAEDVRQAVLGAVTTLRSRLESLPDTLGPQLAVSDEDKARALLADALRHTLDEAARGFDKLARNAASEREHA